MGFGRALSLALLLATAAVPAPAQPAADEALLRRQTQELLDAIAPGEKSVWERYLDDRILYVNESGETRGKADLVGEIQPLPAGLIGRIEIASFDARFHGDTAVTSYVLQEYLDYHGQPLRTRFRTTDTWRRGADGWHLIGSQTLALLRDPPIFPMPARALCAYAGDYALTPQIKGTIACTADGLVMHREGRPDAVYKAEMPDIFFVPGQPRTRRIFQRDARGRVTGFVDRREGEDIRWRRIDARR